MIAAFKFYEKAIFPDRGNYIIALLYCILLFAFGTAYGCFRVGILRLRELVFSHLLTVFLTNFIFYFVLCLVARAMLPVWPMLALTGAQWIFSVFYCWFENKIYFKLYPARKSVVICSKDEDETSFIQKFARVKDRYRIKSVCNESLGYEKIIEEIDRYNTVIIGKIDDSLRLSLMSYCFENGKRLFIMPKMQDIMLNEAHVTQIGDSLVYLCKNRAFSTEQLMIKRALDIFFSLLGLIITLPITLITALAIKLCDGGPVFFTQIRYTRNMKKFKLLKFRSMIVDAEKNGAQLATADDKRITPVGKLIRKTRIDELPQLLNILKGDMSLVGPRPERVETFDAYCKAMPEFSYRTRVKAGLTGYAQIYGKYNTTFEDKVKMDMLYIENCSLMMDLVLLLSTVKVIFMKESTEGFETASIEEFTSAQAEEKTRS